MVASRTVLFAIGMGIAILAVTLRPAQAQDAMFVDSSGNVGVGTNTPGFTLHVFRSGSQPTASVTVESLQSAVGSRRLFFLRNHGDVLFRLENTDSGAQWDFRTTSNGFSITKVGTGQLEAEVRNNGDFAVAGQVITGSSRTFKNQIVPVNAGVVLDKLSQLPIAEWSYKRDPAQRHMGPMAEDFYAAFGLGPDNQHVTPNDLASVALAAAKALRTKSDALQQENDALRQQNQAIQERLDRLEARMDAMAAH